MVLWHSKKLIRVIHISVFFRLTYNSIKYPIIITFYLQKWSLATKKLSYKFMITYLLLQLQ